MEALWNLEDKWKLSTHEAVLFVACIAFLVVIVVVVLCAATATATRRKLAPKTDQDCGGVDEPRPGEAKVSMGHCVRVNKALIQSVRWSNKASKMETSLSLSSSRKEQPTPLLARGGGEVGWPSHNSVSPVWQRPILMGEKCELPRFSGLILYDERGKALDQGHSVDIQEQPTVRATLRDLL